MNLPAAASTANAANNNAPQVWSNLKQAIATSSGFDKWQHSRDVDTNITNTNITNISSQESDLVNESCSLPIIQEGGLDDLVRSYLRETLETLAY